MPPAAQPRSQHPPLAHDARGLPIAIPDGTAAWGVKRQTAGRPKSVIGPNRQPLRLPLDATAADLLDLCGAGPFRLDAIDEAGQVIDFVTTVTVGVDGCGSDAVETEALPMTVARGGSASSDLRYALEVTAHMARAQSEALRSIASAQADWIKGLANAKVLNFRNGMWPVPVAPTSSDQDDDESEEEDDDEEEGIPVGPYDPMTGINTMLGHVAGIAQHVSPLVKPLLSKEQPRNAAPPEVPAVTVPTSAEPPRNARSSRDATDGALHLALILDRLSPDAHRIARGILAGKKDKARELVTALSGLSIERAVGELEMLAADVAKDRAEPAVSTAAPADFTAQLDAVKALLTPEEIGRVVVLVSSQSPEALAAFKAMLLPMTPQDAAAWVRAQLATTAARDGGGRVDR